MKILKLPFPRDPVSSGIAAFVPDDFRQDPSPRVDEPVADLKRRKLENLDRRK